VVEGWRKKHKQQVHNWDDDIRDEVGGAFSAHRGEKKCGHNSG
jgi:hypothetical protein